MKMMTNNILEQTMRDTPALLACRSSIVQAWEILFNSFTNKNKLLVCGNGGSAADCEHIVGELMKGFVLPRPVPDVVKMKISGLCPEKAEYLSGHLQGALPAISLVSHVGLNTAFINDVVADMAYAQQVYGYGVQGDVLLALSTSGNSSNILNAVRIAAACDLSTIAITGSKGGEISSLANCVIKLPADKTYRIQEYMLPVYHCLCAMLEAEFFMQEQ